MGNVLCYIGINAIWSAYPDQLGQDYFEEGTEDAVELLTSALLHETGGGISPMKPNSCRRASYILHAFRSILFTITDYENKQ